MSLTIEQFGTECHDILNKGASDENLEAVRGVLERFLADEEFVGAHLGPDNTEKRKILFEDPELGFCICAHVYLGSASAPPHDHGPTWAIYGQASGQTVMTEFKALQAPQGDTPGKVEPVKTYDLDPGMAVAYPTGRLHAPKREGDTRLIRIEGRNLDHVSREAFELA
tara:strand:- start:55067 stop:55570 length:504 start_codon:yes stop_codon:yes gene_type:complete